jgi:hypothetical protein
MIRLALRSALSDRAADGKVLVVEAFGFERPRTKDAAAALRAIGAEGRVLVVLDGDDAVTWKSFRNLPEVHLLEASQLNAYDVLCSDVVVFTRDTLPVADPVTDAPAPARAAVPVAEPATDRDAPATGRGADAAPDLTESPALGDATADHDDLVGDDEGDDDMASDLPNRPKSTAEKSAPIDPRDRVKNPNEKGDPRFEAAKAKAQREEELRARAAARQEQAGSGDAPAEEESATEEPPTKPGGFSFNMTGDREEEQ